MKIMKILLAALLSFPLMAEDLKYDSYIDSGHLIASFANSPVLGYWEVRIDPQIAPASCSLKIQTSPDNSAWSDATAAYGTTLPADCTKKRKIRVITSAAFIRANATTWTGTGHVDVRFYGYSDADEFSLPGPITGTVPPPLPTGSTIGGVQSIACSGTDKVSTIGTDGIPVCTQDSTGSAIAFREFFLLPGAITFTNLGAAYVEAANQSSRSNTDLSGFTDFRILANFTAAAVSGDAQIHCADLSNFVGQTLLHQFDNPTNNTLLLGAWTAIPAGCKTSGGVYLRVGMLNGNGTEDPAFRWLKIQVR